MTTWHTTEYIDWLYSGSPVNCDVIELRIHSHGLYNLNKLQNLQKLSSNYAQIPITSLKEIKLNYYTTQRNINRIFGVKFLN